MFKNLKEIILDSSAFRKFYIIALSFEMLAVLEVPAIVAKCVALFWGFFLFIHNFCIEKKILRINHYKILLCFIFSMLITCFFNITIWIAPNLAIIGYISVLFFVFYGMYVDTPKKRIEKEMVFVFKFLAYFGAVAGIFSLVIMLFNPVVNVSLFSLKFFSYDLTFSHVLGIQGGRLTGIYTNPNLLAFSMVASIVACDLLCDHYIYNKYRSEIKINRWIFRFMMTVQCGCLFISDSNAAIVFLIVYVCMRVFWSALFEYGVPKGKRVLKSFLLVLGFGVIMIPASLIIREGCQNVVYKTLTNVYNSSKSVKKSHIPDIDKEEKNVKDEFIIPDLQIGRQNYEVSSGRKILWKQGFKIFKKYPIFGIGRWNLVSYGKKIIEGGLIFPDLHNAYLSILVSNGMVGFLIFAAFSFFVAVEMCKNVFINYYCYCQITGIFMKMFSVLVAYCGYCLFEKSIIYDITFAVGFFWLILGYAVAINSRDKEDNGVKNSQIFKRGNIN